MKIISSEKVNFKSVTVKVRKLMLYQLLITNKIHNYTSRFF